MRHWLVTSVLIVGLAMAVSGQGARQPAGASLSDQAERGDPLALNYVANMGVLVGSGDIKVLIDSLFDKPSSVQRLPTPGTLERIMKGEAPFDGVDLVLVTHRHSDHFDAARAVRYLEAHPGPILMAPSDAVEAMRQVAGDWPGIERRIVPITLEVGQHVAREVARIPLTCVRTSHGSTKTPMNLMYLVEVSGWRVFHEGDPGGKPDVYLGFGLERDPVDLAVLNYGWALGPHRRFLREVLEPDRIALGHLHIMSESDAPRRVGQLAQYFKDIFPLLPGMSGRVFRR